jgi:hypothetical protein
VGTGYEEFIAFVGTGHDKFIAFVGKGHEEFIAPLFLTLVSVEN